VVDEVFGAGNRTGEVFHCSDGGEKTLSAIST